MRKLRTGMVEVVHDSPTVTGTNTGWTGLVSAGDLFKILNENAIYSVQSVDSATQITLSSDYVGSSDSGLSYIVHRWFTTNYDFPLLSRKGAGLAWSELALQTWDYWSDYTWEELAGSDYIGDKDFSELFKYSVRKIDKLLAGV